MTLDTLEAELPSIAGIPARPGVPVTPEGRLTFERLRQFWAVRSLAAGALSTCLDLVVLIALVQLAHLNPVVAAMVGVVAGGTVNFFLNKYFAFRDRDPKVGRQIFRYALGTGLALGLHAGVVYTLTSRLGVHYILAKLLADVLVFSLGGLLLNRYVVFPERAVLAEEAGRTLACLTLAAAFTGTPALPSGGCERAGYSSPVQPGGTLALEKGRLARPGAADRTAGATSDTPPSGSLAQAMAPRTAVAPERRGLASRAFSRMLSMGHPRAPGLKRRRRPPKSAA